MQFYSPFGQLLRTLRVPGTSLRSLSWEGSGLRLSLAVDSHIFFANVRPAYMWTYFSTTLAYATWRKEKGEHQVVYWAVPPNGGGADANATSGASGFGNSVLGQSQSGVVVKTYRTRLAFLLGDGSCDACAVVTKPDANSGAVTVHLNNAIGAPLEKREVQLFPGADSQQKAL